MAGKGKRRRSSDEDAAGEPKAKRPKYSTDNKEVMGLGVLILRQGRKSTKITSPKRVYKVEK